MYYYILLLVKDTFELAFAMCFDYGGTTAGDFYPNFKFPVRDRLNQKLFDALSEMEVVIFDIIFYYS